MPHSAESLSNMRLKSFSSLDPGFPMYPRTRSEVCSGATFICPETWSSTMQRRYSSPCLLSARIMS